jgi:hypothetical protein
MDALSTRLARLSRHAQLCARALDAAAASAVDLQLRAMLSRQAEIQHAGAADLAYRAGACMEAHQGYPGTVGDDEASHKVAAHVVERVALDNDTVTHAVRGESSLLRSAARHVGRAAAAYGAILREAIPDPELRLLLVHHYRNAIDLQRQLAQRAVELTPPARESRRSGAAARRP